LAPCLQRDVYLVASIYFNAKPDQDQLLGLCKYCGYFIAVEFLIFNSSELSPKGF